MARRRLQEMEGQVPMGEERIPYDQTDPMVDVAAPTQAAPEALPEQAPAPGGILAPTIGGEVEPAAVGPVGAGLTTDDLTGNDLAALGEPVDVGEPEDLEVERLNAILDDPTVPEQDKAQVMQLLDLAARRRLAGAGSQSQAGSLLI